MQPVSILPVAAILLGVGYMLDPSGWGSSSPIASFLIKSGGAILDNLPMLFAVGVAYGLSKDKNGAAALCGLVSMYVITTLLSPGSVANLKGVTDSVEIQNIDVIQGFGKISNAFTGILAGVVGAYCYNKFYQTKLPVYLSFFSGRRLAPIITAFLSIITASILFFMWPIIYKGLTLFGNSILNLGALGAGVYAFANRLLIPTGLHHALNAVFWFDTIGIGDLTNFLAGKAALESGKAVIGETGMYMGGWFPVMMFGLPAAAFAMYRQAKPEKKALVFSLLLSGAFASFLTGVTEPIEFSFMFLSPMLYLLHSVLTGVSVFIAASLHYTAGFGFSAGLFDFILSLSNPVANKPLMLLPLGLVIGILYYLTFTFAIKKFDLKTPGREDDEIVTDKNVIEKDNTFKDTARIILKGIGGSKNINSVEHCITRLRLEVKDMAKVDDALIKTAQISGIIKPTKSNVQVIVGTQVQFVYDEFVKLMNEKEENSNVKDNNVILLELLGGNDNIDSVSYCSTRLRIEVKDGNKINKHEITEIYKNVLYPTQFTVNIVDYNNSKKLYEKFISLLNYNNSHINIVGKTQDEKTMAKLIVDGLSGPENIEEIEKCSSKLRVKLKNIDIINENKIKKSNIAGIVRLSGNNIQIVIGSKTDEVYDEIMKLI